MKVASLQPRGVQGFSLVEVTLALGLAAFCLVVLLGLIPTGVNTDKASLEQTAGAGVAAAVVADLRATPKTSGAVSPRFGIAISQAKGSLAKPETVYLAEDGSATGIVGAAPVTNAASGTPISRYRVSLSFFDPPPTALKGPTAVRMLVTWPAAADKDPDQAPKKYVSALEVVTALDRN